MKRIAAIRRQLALDLGFLLPTIRFTDNMLLRSREYTALLKGIEISRFELPNNVELAIAHGEPEEELDGEPTREPAFGMPAIWIPEHDAAHARAAGYTVVDPVSVMGTHLMQLIRRHAHELFSRQETKRLLDRVAVEHSRAVEDLVPKLLPLTTVHKVLQNLLREQVSIRDTVSILEALGDAAMTTKNPILLTEFVRQSIRRAVVQPYLNPTGALPAYFVDPTLEDAIAHAVEHSEQNSHLALAPPALRDFLNRLGRSFSNLQAPVAVVTSSTCRYFMRVLAEASVPNAYFLSHNEIPPSIKVVSLGVVQ